MTPTFWRRMAIVLSVVNVAGAGFAIAPRRRVAFRGARLAGGPS